ncbi:MAG TPA: methyltransferase domain-containing protein [Pseudonocardiaceae bacterium]|jgi:SAM-dependent methyltransferase|nr:methyltransferase domain-containing protein [Pseudonocardiaceae bacterium]
MTTQGWRGALLARTAEQLGNPHGLLGRYVVAKRLNRGNKAPIARAIDALAVEPGQTVADIGFGGGIGLRMLLAKVGPTGTVHGIDRSPTMLAKARKDFHADAGRLRLHAGSITDLPLPDAALDGAICVNVLYFVADLAAAFGAAARVLRPGGRLVLGVVDRAWLAREPVTRHGFILREIDEYRAALTEAGLTVREHRQFEIGHLLVAEADAA